MVYKREDPSFVQGLQWDPKKKLLVESVGLYEESRTQFLAIYDDIATIQPVQVTPYEDDKLFGEGITLLNETHYIELTWKEKVVRLLDRNTLTEKSQFKQWDGVK